MRELYCFFFNLKGYQSNLTILKKKLTNTPTRKKYKGFLFQDQSSNIIVYKKEK